MRITLSKIKDHCVILIWQRPVINKNDNTRFFENLAKIANLGKDKYENSKCQFFYGKHFSLNTFKRAENRFFNILPDLRHRTNPIYHIWKKTIFFLLMAFIIVNNVVINMTIIFKHLLIPRSLRKSKAKLHVKHPKVEGTKSDQNDYHAHIWLNLQNRFSKEPNGKFHCGLECSLGTLCELNINRFLY